MSLLFIVDDFLFGKQFKSLKLKDMFFIFLKPTPFQYFLTSQFYCLNLRRSLKTADKDIFLSYKKRLKNVLKQLGTVFLSKC